MKIKWIIGLLTVSLSVFIACNRNRHIIHNEFTLPLAAVSEEVSLLSAPEVNIRDSLELRDKLGSVIEDHFEGLLPSADGPGIQYDLTLWSQERSDEGVFYLATTYLGDGDHQVDRTFITQGRSQLILRKHLDNEDIIHELIPLDGTSPIYFIEDGENLTLMNQEMERISSINNHNYTLSKRK